MLHVLLKLCLAISYRPECGPGHWGKRARVCSILLLRLDDTVHHGLYCESGQSFAHMLESSSSKNKCNGLSVKCVRGGTAVLPEHELGVAHAQHHLNVQNSLQVVLNFTLRPL